MPSGARVSLLYLHGYQAGRQIIRGAVLITFTGRCAENSCRKVKFDYCHNQEAGACRRKTRLCALSEPVVCTVQKTIPTNISCQSNAALSFVTDMSALRSRVRNLASCKTEEDPGRYFLDRGLQLLGVSPGLELVRIANAVARNKEIPKQPLYLGMNSAECFLTYIFCMPA